MEIMSPNKVRWFESPRLSCVNLQVGEKQEAYLRQAFADFRLDSRRGDSARAEWNWSFPRTK